MLAVTMQAHCHLRKTRYSAICCSSEKEVLFHFDKDTHYACVEQLHQNSCIRTIVH